MDAQSNEQSRPRRKAASDATVRIQKYVHAAKEVKRLEKVEKQRKVSRTVTQDAETERSGNDKDTTAFEQDELLTTTNTTPSDVSDDAEHLVEKS
jgi:hypothetical protein